MIRETRLQGVYEMMRGKKHLILTKSLNPGKSVYGESLYNEGGEEFREWVPNRSKLGAAIMNNISQIGIKEGTIVLYLGAASGTTPSHVSDLVGKTGFVFALDFAPRVVRDLVFLCKARPNICPILGGAEKINETMLRVSMVDVVYQDIAQRSQGEIFIKNCDMFLKSGGFGILCVKARSVDVTKNPKEIFRRIAKELEDSRILTIVDQRTLEPFEKDHWIFLCKKK